MRRDVAAGASRMRIVHLPTDLGMRGYSLSRAERAMGLDSTAIVRMSGVHQSGSVTPLQGPSRLASAWRWARALVRAFRADVVMANSGSSLLDFSTRSVHLAEIPVYRALGTRLIVTFQGCDVRPCEGCPVRAALPEGEVCTNVPRGMDYDGFDAFKRRRLERWRRHADAMLGITPDLCAVEGVRYSPHAKWLDDAGVAPRPPRMPGDGRPLRVGHMPKRHIKGSEWVEPRLRELCADLPGRVEYVPIAGMAWADALRALASCDVVVDQVLIGWYGGISVEAALLGVVPIAVVNPAVLRHVEPPLRDDLPVVAIRRKEEMAAAIRRLLDDPAELRREAERCRASALAHHDARHVAEQLVERYYRA